MVYSPDTCRCYFFQIPYYNLDAREAVEYSVGTHGEDVALDILTKLQGSQPKEFTFVL